LSAGEASERVFRTWKARRPFGVQALA
jgi:hypothetical protein